MTEKISGSGQNVILVPGLPRRPGRADRRRRHAALVRLHPDLRLAADFDLQPLRERVHDGDADAVQTARDLVRVVVELSARVEVRHDDLERLALMLLVQPDRDAAAVVLDGDGVVGVDRHRDGVRVADLRLVDRVVDELEDHVVEPGEVVGVADVHPGPLANGLEPLQELDRVGGVGGAHVPFVPVPVRACPPAGRPAAIGSTVAGDSPEPRGVRRRGQDDRGPLGQPREETVERTLREAGVEVVDAEQGRLARRVPDDAPLGELRQGHDPVDLPRRRPVFERVSGPCPDEVIAMRSGQRSASQKFHGKEVLQGLFQV